MAIYNLLGILGYLLVAIGVFNKDDLITKKLIIAACIVNSGYFFLQDLFVSSAVVLLTATRIYISLKERPHYVGWIFILLTLGTPLYAPSTDYIAMIPSLLGVIAVYWFQGIAMRSIMLTGTAFWVINNYIEGAWIGFFGEIFVLTVGLSRLALMIRERSEIKVQKNL